MRDVLLIFARWPEPGRCKTRLIPELGEAAATELHAEMTRYTLSWARQLSSRFEVAIEVHFSGGNRWLMSQAFGHDVEYVPQAPGDLGEKLREAFQRERKVAAQRLVVVGTDCPQLTADLVAVAFARLSEHDMCVAPAADGGYVLLGINTLSHPSLPNLLFQHIDWGSNRVLSQTLTRVEQSAATCAVLPTLSDVDHPADLAVWQRAQQGVAGTTPAVSVIIPTYNEEPALAATIDSALAGKQVEIIVVAAGRFHSSVRVAAETGVQCLVAMKADRGARMNLGATQATADVLLFLHADTRLPVGYASAIEQALGDAGTVGGAFELRIESPRMIARWVERGTRWRTAVCRLPYGDQAIFVRRQVFAELAGFRSQTIMEDYEFVRRLRRAGKLATPQEGVRTSARRWEKRGFLRTTLINQCMLLGYHLGVPLDRLAKFYRGRP